MGVQKGHRLLWSHRKFFPELAPEGQLEVVLVKRKRLRPSSFLLSEKTAWRREDGMKEVCCGWVIDQRGRGG